MAAVVLALALAAVVLSLVAIIRSRGQDLAAWAALALAAAVILPRYL